MTVNINVEYPGQPKNKNLNVQGMSIREILEKLRFGVPEDARIFINTLEANLDSHVNDGDIIHVFPPVTLIKDGTVGVIKHGKLVKFQPKGNNMSQKGVHVDIRGKEVPWKLIFHCMMLIIPLFTSIWLYLLQFLFLSPLVIIDSIHLYKIYGGGTCHIFKNNLDFIFEIVIPVYRHKIIMALGGYLKWHGVE